METVVYFLRHGETDYNIDVRIQGQCDIPLNANGIKQAQITGKRLQKMHFDCIYSSDLQRAAVTASYAAGTREIHYTPLLREWFFGEWQNKQFPEIEKLFPEELKLYRAKAPSFCPNGGESTALFRKRAADVMQMIAEKNPGQTVLCVSHGGLIRAVLQNISDPEVFKTLPHADNTSISCFKTPDNGKSWQLVSWNDNSHLDNCTQSEGI